MGSAWLAQLGQPDMAPDRVLITSGTTHGIFLVLATVLQSDDQVVINHGIIGLSNVLGFTLCRLPIDREGILPDVFEEACRTAKFRALFCTPTLTNPIGPIVARTNNVYIIKDRIYHPLIRSQMLRLGQACPGCGRPLRSLGFQRGHAAPTTPTPAPVGYRVGTRWVPGDGARDGESGRGGRCGPGSRSGSSMRPGPRGAGGCTSTTTWCRDSGCG